MYRVDLADLGQPLHDLADYLIFNIDILHSFAVDYQNYRLYFPNETKNTMLSIYLDGSDVVDIRPNVQSPDFIEICLHNLTYNIYLNLIIASRASYLCFYPDHVPS